MPRYPMVEKYVNGRLVTQRQWRKAVVDAIDAGPPEGSTITMIGERLGPAWVEPVNVPILSHTLQNFKRKGIVECPSRGVYRVVVNAVDVFTDHENAILDSIRKRGGVCRWRDIADDFGVRNKDVPLTIEQQANESDAAWRLRFDAHEPINFGIRSMLVATIAESDRIRQDFGVPGLYNLPYEELHALPMLGSWAIYMHRRAVMLLTPQGERWDEELVGQMTNAHYKRVGAAFRAVRDLKYLDLETLVDDKVFIGILRQMADKSDVAVNDILREQKARILSRHGIAFDSGIIPPEVTEELDDAREAAMNWKSLTIPAGLLGAFEDGSPAVHRVAPADFYTEFCQSFVDGPDPVLLSRGILAPGEPEHRIRPDPNTMSEEQKKMLAADGGSQVYIPAEWGEGADG
ncbi:hypothetical protein BAJUN_01560 [Bajunvirus bajun]|uniref:Uncharacterized protein n=1 Tax=Brevundimonas phage vB_BgoS-Bajun TaxID=2948594 RepID=A0A9E7N4K3_9CAUD|nr:hypothetical protein BAJUN_01560 [Brevundimonas phage vB_BgoS-Bajun]